MLSIAIAASLCFIPNASVACACGCSVFDVGAGTMMPTDSASGFSLWFRYSHMDQNQNWEGSSKAPASDNSDIRIRTSFYTVGGNFTIDRAWTVMAELPIYSRRFTSTDDGTVADNSLAYFVQARYQFAALTRNDYRPGNDLNGALGLTWGFSARGSQTRVTPLVQLIGSYRERDSGANSDPLNSGYRRLLLAPGVEARLGKVRLYADVEFPTYVVDRAGIVRAVLMPDAGPVTEDTLERAVLPLLPSGHPGP